MKKAEKIKNNAKVDEFMEKNPQLTNAWELVFKCHAFNGVRLRSCSAMVYMVSGVAVLKSYDTVVAVIDRNGIGYDFLRKVYGYTATSAQHITKFFEDYGAIKSYRWEWV